MPRGGRKIASKDSKPLQRRKMTKTERENKKRKKEKLKQNLKENISQLLSRARHYVLVKESEKESKEYAFQ